MPTKLYITLDVYLKDWTATTGEVWVCLQPHVVGDDNDASQLEAWIRDSSTGGAFAYSMKAPGDPSNLIPVNFPDDVNVGLQIQFDDGTSKTISNMRRSSLKVLDPGSLDKANRQAPIQGAVNSSTTSQPVPQDFFSVAYNKSVRAAATSAAPTDIKNMMVLAFWGGTRRYVPSGAIDLSSATNLMTLEDSADPLVTNLHSLNGLMFLLGARPDVSTLKAVKDIHVLLSTGDPGTQPFSVSRDDASAQGTITNYFHNIPDTLPQDRLPSATWDIAVTKRIYVLDSLMPFANEATFDDGRWYRGRVERGGDPAALQLSRLNRLSVHFNADATVPAPDPARPEWNQLDWAVFDSLDLVLTPYRMFPSTNKNVMSGPLRLRPLSADSQRFEALLSAQPDILKRSDIKLLDSQGIDYREKLLFLGAYSFPWDAVDDDIDDEGNPCSGQPHTTVLMFGAMPSSGSATKCNLTLIFPRLAVDNTPLKLTTQRLGDGATPDAFGLRWEFTPTGALPAEDFSFLRCTTDSVDAEHLSRLVPGAAFKGVVNFEFAQSVSNIETAMNVLFEHPDPPPDPQHVDPVEEFVHDLINHNALNVYASWDGKGLDVDEGPQQGRKTTLEFRDAPAGRDTLNVGHLNPYGQIYPVNTKQNSDNKAYNYRFVFRHLVKTTEPPLPSTGDAPDVRGFFSDLYNRTGQQRTLAFDLQHTYGTLITVPIVIDGQSEPYVGNVASFFDFSPIIPPDVFRPQTSNNPSGSATAPCAPGPSHFITAAFTSNADSSESVTLVLQTAWLRPEYYSCGNGEMRSAHIAAWRTIAEIAYSASVGLTGLFRRFSFSQALTPCATNSVAAGLQPVEDFENHPEWPIPDNAFRSVCYHLLNDPHPQINDTLSVQVVLTQSTDQLKIASTCNVIELALHLKRDPAHLPDNSVASWTFVRSLPAFDENGQKTEPVTDPTAIASFSTFVSSLSERKKTISPEFLDPSQGKESAYLQRILGGSGVSADEADSGTGSSWIVPGGFKYTGSAVPSVTPLAFRPFPLDNFLGSGTFNLILSYFEAVQAVLSCRFEDGWTWKDTDWLAFFNDLQDRVVPLIDPTHAGTILNAARELLLAVPPNDGTVEQEVKNTVAAFLDSTSRLFNAFRSWLTSRFWADPSIFSTARGFLYHRLRGSTSGPVPDDFFRIDSVRQTGKAGDATDAPRLNFKESLAELRDSDQYGIPEIIPYLNYDKSFVFTSYSLPNFEGVLFDAANAPPSSGSRLSVPIDGTPPVLHLPDAPPQPLPTKPMLLPSRAPLIPPVHLFTGQVDQFKTGGYDPNLAGTSFGFNSLKLGEFKTPVGSEEAVSFIARTAPFPSPPTADEYVLTAIFSIRGDEDTAMDWYTAFDSDNFIFDYRESTQSAATNSPTVKPASTVEKLFQELSKQTHPELITSLPQLVFDNDVVQFVANALKAIPATSPIATDTLSISHADSQSITLTLTDAPESPPVFQACLFASPVTAGDTPAKFILIVNRISKVWTRGAIGLTQTRNVRRSFSREFGEVSGEVMPDQPYQPLVVQPLAILRKPLDKRICSVADLVALLPTQIAPVWRTFDVSVTISHKQQRCYPSVYMDDQGSLRTDQLLNAQSSSFPLLNPQYAANAPDDSTAVVFDPWYKDFLIELQWSSKSNLQFLRISLEGSFTA